MASNSSYIDIGVDTSHYTSNLPPSFQKITTFQALLYGFLLLASYRSFEAWRMRPNVPGVGFPPIPILGPWIAAYRFTMNPVKLTTEGYEKYKPGFFRIATIMGEYVIVTDRNKVQEYLRAPDDVLSFQDAANDQQQIPFTMGWGIGYRTYHAPIIRTQLTSSIKDRCDEMADEAKHAVADEIGSPADYQPIPIYPVLAMIVARISNRTFAGKELCKDKEYLRNAIDYAEAVVMSAELIRAFPAWMKHLLMRISPVWPRRRKAIEQLTPILKKRMAGDFDGGKKPDDLMQWLIDQAPPTDRSIIRQVERMMAMNVGSIHMTTMTFSAALFTLATEPEKYMDELRAELEQVLAEGPLTRDRLNKLVKMDSFLRESERYNNAGLLSIQRNAKKKFVFSDGTVIPAGAKIGTAALFAHRDPAFYDNPQVFDGFRFARLREENQGSSAAFQAVTTAPELHVFGHGKHACPGRFFAVTEMKLIFAELIMRYDMKMAPGDEMKQTFIATMSIPDSKTNILMKLRS